jgi:hypothetical protein
LALVILLATFKYIITRDEFVEYPLSLAAFLIFLGGNVLMQLVRIYYNRVVLATFWAKEDATSLKNQLLVIGELRNQSSLNHPRTAFIHLIFRTSLSSVI